MQINLAHILERATDGTPVNVAVFDARSNSGSQTDNSRLLAQLAMKARGAGLRVDQAALAFTESGRIKFFGTKTLVDHLARSGLPNWTHTINA